MLRERWTPSGHWGFGVDHIVPKSHDLAGLLRYENLALACNECNSRKKDVVLPEVLESLDLHEHLSWNEAGMAVALTQEGAFLIDLLILNDPARLDVRGLIIELWNNAKQELASNPNTKTEKMRLFEYPRELPDLRDCRPPGGNILPDGLDRCAFVLRERGQLTRFY